MERGRKMERIRQGLTAWLPTITAVVVIVLAIALVIFLFAKIPGDIPVWIPAVLVVTIVVVLAIVAISVLVPGPANAEAIDPVPVRLGVILLGVIVVACVAGLIQVINNPPQVVEPTPSTSGRPRHPTTSGQ